ncbi:L-fuculose-phosphate aldolase [Meinhardsimonia xiamenensis]|jgi:L-fuculose-phosphate aldolase|uniref:L-fuculose-phosphate aldolase n=1 Tax=Meinhardsimonia xiamenensis TaxID=990712 RepID=A0A1G9F3V5_9RHOB|nr:class II aldolase/adducin family protein [Meinhardsimonia xiamenensis]PRX38010.1 L-fuculose-phosphate aldolase [Meinhardsimonia xiamenensis]SDK83018.1 L-fuculose-phosphate aldolase [Meinhardsimonia xiamenensis]
METEERRKRQAIIDICLKMNASGLNQGTSGNVSLRHGEGLLITPSGRPYESLVPEDIVYLAMDGRAEGRWKPSSEWRFHRDILAARPEAGAVLHAHPPHCTALAIMERDIPPIHYMVAVFGGDDVRCAPYATYGTEALSAHALAALEGRNACLLAHHGMIVAGRDLDHAWWLAEELEALARQYLLCLPMGEPPRLNAEQMAEVHARIAGYGRA